MNAFGQARAVEQRSLAVLRPFIQQRAFDGQYVITAKGPLAPVLQKSIGDVLYNSDAETVYSIEIKAEMSNKHGNLFLETWSNRSRFTLGWMFTLNADLLLYHFLEENELYVINFERLRKWAFHEGRIYSFREKCQEKYQQLNDTWGRCVPIIVIQRDVGCKFFRPDGETRWRAGSQTQAATEGAESLTPGP